MRTLSHHERHPLQRIGWLRAAVLGANDGIVSTASLIIGVAAADAAQSDIYTAATAALVGGAMSMAAGEYVSVSSQADTEKASMEQEKLELKQAPEAELQELTQIYIARGLTPELAADVARQLTDHDAYAAHLRDELGMTDALAARPVQAAFTSAATFATGASLPFLAALLSPQALILPSVSLSALLALALLGALGAKAGRANTWKAVIRVSFWGALAMTITALIGTLTGIVV